MTIVAGFKCKNGVVLLADTEHTATSTKFNAPKMWSDGDRSIVANAGANDYTKDAIDELSLKFSQRKMKWTAATVRTAVKKVLVDVHQRIRSAYSASDPDRPQVYLMLAARLDDWSTILIKASETATPLVNTFDFIGAGQDIARFLISPFYEQELRVTEMQVIGTYLFRYAKTSGLFCGGDTHIGLLFDGIPEAKYAHPAQLRRDPEVVAGHLLGIIAPVLSACWNVEVKPDEFNTRLENLAKWLRLQRKRQEDARNRKEHS